MDGSIVSENSGTPKIIHFNRVFHYKPSILGYHYFWKHPYGDGINRLSWPILIVCDILGLFHLLRNEDKMGTLGLFHLLINGDTLGWHNPLILTLDPNFLKHPSTLVHSGFWQSFWCDGKYYTPWNEHLRTWKWLVGNYWEMTTNPRKWTNSSPKKGTISKRKWSSFQAPIFRGYVSFSKGNKFVSKNQTKIIRTPKTSPKEAKLN